MALAERTLPTPVYAVVGAGDVVVQEAKEAYDRIQSRLTETRVRLSELPGDVSVDDIRAKLTVEELKSLLNPEELRKVTAPYVETATDLYKDLASRGEGAVERLRTQSVVQDNLERVGKVYNDAVDLTEEALGAVSEQTRAVGERAASLAGLAADKVEDAAAVASEVADKVEEAAADIEEAGNKIKAESKVAAKKIQEAASTVDDKARAAKPEAAKPAAKKAPARKNAAKTAPTTK